MYANTQLLPILLAGLVSLAGAADPDDAKNQSKDRDGFKSGPAVGDFLPSGFHSYNVTGKRSGKLHCLVCDHGLEPAVLVFTREIGEPDQPLGALLKQLDTLIEKNPRADLGVFVVVLHDAVGDERLKLARQLQDLAKQLELKHVVLAVNAAAGPKDYALHADAGTTILLYHKHKVLANFAAPLDRPLAEADAQAVLAAVSQKLLKKAPAPAAKKKPQPPAE